VFVKPDYFWIVDEIEGVGRHLIESFWHLPPQALVAARPQGLEVRAPGADLTMLWVDDFAERELWAGVEQPVQGWSSPRFGVRIAAPVVRCVTEQPTPCHFGVLLRPHSKVAGPSAAVSAGSAVMGQGEGWWAIGMPGEDLVLRNGATGSIRIGARTVTAELRGKAALIRWQGGGISAVAGHGLERLTIDGEVVVEVDSGSVDCGLRRVGDQAIVTGTGGRLGFRIPGIAVMRGSEGTLPTERREGALWLNLRPEPARIDPGTRSADAARVPAGTPRAGVL